VAEGFRGDRVVRRAAILLAALLAAALAGAPAALADTLTVTGTGDDPGFCSGTDCPSLRAALATADLDPQADAIVFSDALGTATITADTTLPATTPVDVNGGTDITIAQAPSAAGPLLSYEPGASGSSLRNIALSGPGAGTASSTSLVSTAASDMTISNSTLRGAGTAAVSIDGSAQHVRVTQNSIYGYGTKAISFDSGGVNGGIGAPAGLRVGPRQADGSLPVPGSTGTGGGLELFSGPQQVFAFGAALDPGNFSVRPLPEPSPGETVSATITDTAGDTSEYASATVPDDVVSPWLAGAVATSRGTIDVQASEPIDPASLQPADFGVEMAGVDRVPLGATANPEGTRITLFFGDSWESAEAGIMRLTGVGAIADTSGNVSLVTTDVRVGGAPGDFIPPVITSFRLNPNRGVCFVIGPRCKRDRTAIIFRSSEDGDTYITVFRGSRRIGERRYTGQPGSNYIRFDGKIRGRRLGSGLYRMYVAMQDESGNRTPYSNQPHAIFRVKRTTRRR
jgi:hypothetical protein